MYYFIISNQYTDIMQVFTPIDATKPSLTTGLHCIKFVLIIWLISTNLIQTHGKTAFRVGFHFDTQGVKILIPSVKVGIKLIFGTENLLRL